MCASLLVTQMGLWVPPRPAWHNCEPKEQWKLLFYSFPSPSKWVNQVSWATFFLYRSLSEILRGIWMKQKWKRMYMKSPKEVPIRFKRMVYIDKPRRWLTVVKQLNSGECAIYIWAVGSDKVPALMTCQQKTCDMAAGRGQQGDSRSHILSP